MGAPRGNCKLPGMPTSWTGTRRPGSAGRDTACPGFPNCLHSPLSARSCVPVKVEAVSWHFLNLFEAKSTTISPRPSGTRRSSACAASWAVARPRSWPSRRASTRCGR
jgi:hypothetical protein